MTDDLARLSERARQNRAALSDEALPAAPPSTTASAGVARTPVAGDRVVDRVTGREGVIAASVSTNSKKQVIYPVRLATGGILLRALDQLVILPPPPATPT